MLAGVTLQGDDSFKATFNQSVGAVKVVAKKLNNVVVLEIPAGSTTDGGGAAIAAAAGTLPAELRPAAAISFSAIVTNNAAKVTGKLVVGADGALTFTSSAAGGNFTDNAAAGFDRIAVTYTLA